MAELEMVSIRHPRIDDGHRVIEVPVSAWPHHQRAGWELVAPPDRQAQVAAALVETGLTAEEAERVAAAAVPADPPDPADEPTGGSSPADTDNDQSPRRRRATPKDGE
ncbi:MULTISPECIES: hypothetical protein [unclassified Nonomuraea]|uniref:hypothetical protein n=1 Tax=unclassified Nonomuraea TaxID=2593643 RepID=UPI0033DCC805